MIDRSSTHCTTRPASVLVLMETRFQASWIFILPRFHWVSLLTGACANRQCFSRQGLSVQGVVGNRKLPGQSSSSVFLQQLLMALGPTFAICEMACKGDSQHLSPLGPCSTHELRRPGASSDLFSLGTSPREPGQVSEGTAVPAASCAHTHVQTSFPSVTIQPAETPVSQLLGKA